MDLLGDELFAGAGLALDEHRRVRRGDVLEQREHLPHLGVATDDAAERGEGARLGNDDLFVGEELEDGAAELDLGAKPDRDLLEPRALDERAVRRAAVDHHHFVVDELRFEVLARHGLVGQDKTALRARSERNGSIRQTDGFSAIRPLDDEEDAALVLP